MISIEKTISSLDQVFQSSARETIITALGKWKRQSLSEVATVARKRLNTLNFYISEAKFETNVTGVPKLMDVPLTVPIADRPRLLVWSV